VPAISFRSRFTRSRAHAFVCLACIFQLSVWIWGQTAGHPASKDTHAADFSTLSAKADAARNAEHLDEATSLYRRALALRPSWAEGWWSLGTIYYDHDSYREAAQAFQRLTKLDPKNGPAHAMLGLSQFELKQDDAALSNIDAGLDLGLPKNEELIKVLLYHKGMLQQRRGSLQSAQTTLEELCLRNGSSDEVAQVLGLTMLHSTAAQPPTSGSPQGNIVLGVGRAECLAGQKQYDHARSAYEKLTAENAQYPYIHYAFGLFLLKTRDTQRGITQLQQELANQPDSVVTRLWIAAAEYKENSAAGIPYAEEAVKLAPQQPFGHYLLGLLLLDVDDYNRAIPELETASRGLPHEAKVFFALGTAYSRAGRKQDAARARATFQRVSEEAKTNGSKDQPSASSDVNIPLADAPAPQ